MITPHESTARRRRLVVAMTLLVGALVLWRSLALPPGDPRFYPWTFALAAVWALGALVSGGVRLGRHPGRPGRASVQVLPAFVTGVLLLAVFLVGAVVVSRVPLLAAPVDALLDHARRGSLGLVLLITVVNGVVEEMFFRGALMDALPCRWALPGSVAVYALSTVGSGVPLLVFAAVVLGLVTALQRRASGGVLAPVITHVTWSTGMLLLLPPVLETLR